MLKYLLAVSMALISTSALADENEIINADVKQAFNETQQSMQQSVDQMDQTMQKIIPEISAGMNEMMNNIMKTLPPLMSSLERNQVFSKASDELNRQFQQNIKELNQNYEKYLKSQTANDTTEEFNISGSKSVNGQDLDFAFNQNPEDIQETSDIIDAKVNGSKTKEIKAIKDLKGYYIKAANFQLDSYVGNVFLKYVPEPNQAFIVGNLNNKINFKIQTTGENALQRATEFMASLRSQYLK